MNWQSVFRVAIRIVFLFAFIAFLSASVSHVAVFFNNFEADKGNWVEPYMLAISIDLTALVLTIGVMFFRKEMPWYALLITWIFIIGLTAFSWTVNWEYAQTYQGTLLNTNDTLSMINPILASSFAFFNLVYSFVSEFFGMKQKTAVELLTEADRLEALEEAQKRIDAYRERNRKKSFIQSAKDTLIEAKEAVIEVRNGNSETAQEAGEEEVTADMEADVDTATSGHETPAFSDAEMDMEADELADIDRAKSGQDEESESDIDTDPEVDAVNVLQFHQHRTSGGQKEAVKVSGRRKSMSAKEAAAFLECSDRQVRRLRENGTLVTDESDRLTSASVKAYKKKRDAKFGMEGA